MNIVHCCLLLLNLSIGSSYPVAVFFLLFQQNPRIPFRLTDQHHEHHKHHEHRNSNLNGPAQHHIGTDGTNLFADDIIPNQNCHHPIRTIHR